MKCYLVQLWNGDNQQIVFAEKRSEAILKSDAYEWDGDYTAVRATRESSYDKYADQGVVPKDVLLADGWWFECTGRKENGYICGEHLTAEYNPVIIADRVYCSFKHAGMGVSK